MQTCPPSVPATAHFLWRQGPRAWRITAAVVFSGILLALAGCASTIDAKVTRFNQWPADAAGQTFSFSAPQAGRELEFRAYHALAARELQAQGLVPASDGQVGRFVVDVQARQTEQRRTQLVAVYSDEWAYLPAWRDSSGRLYGGHWVPDRFGGRYVGDREVTRTVQASEMRLRISDQRAGAKPETVFDATAVQESPADDLAEVMPFLMQGVFQDFPGANGQVRRLRFELPER